MQDSLKETQTQGYNRRVVSSGLLSDVNKQSFLNSNAASLPQGNKFEVAHNTSVQMEIVPEGNGSFRSSTSSL